MHFNLICQGNDSIITTPGNYEVIHARIMGYLNPTICDGDSLKNLIGYTFNMGPDTYKIERSEGVVGYPERMAQMVTAKKITNNSGWLTYAPGVLNFPELQENHEYDDELSGHVKLP